jgi:thioredoxin reductase (NADPH)
MIYDCLIVGAGPGGLSAALYFGRAGVSTIIIEKSAPGGKVITTSSVENYPGVVSTTGAGLALNMMAQLKPYNIPSARKAVKQIINYNNKLGGGYEMVIVLY